MIVSSSLWNLVSLVNMNSHHLRKNEVEYELKIRGVSHMGNANDLRKRLTECYSSNTPVADEVIEQLNPEEEIEVCEEKYEDLEGLVADYDGSFKDNEYNRILARLWHLNLRIGRIPTTEESVAQHHITTQNLKTKSKTLIDDFMARKEAAIATLEKKVEKEEVPTTESDGSMDTSSSSATILSSSAATSTTSTSSSGAATSTTSALSTVCTTAVVTPPLTSSVTSGPVIGTTWTSSFSAMPSVNSMVTVPPATTSTSRHHVPVFKWGLQFECNSSQSVGSFLQRVEELRRARGVREDELFQSAVDLFKGTALIWYRSTLGRIKSWQELCKELRTVFQSPDYDIRLQREILNRFQGPNEPIDLYSHKFYCLWNLYRDFCYWTGQTSIWLTGTYRRAPETDC